MKTDCRLDIVPVSMIEEGTRFRVDMGDIHELSESLKREGVIQPLAVKQDDGKLLLLAGGRRLAAAKRAGFETLPVRIYPSDLSEIEIRAIELAENLYRKNLEWAEEVDLKRKIHGLQIAIHGNKTSTLPGAEGWSQRDTASMINESPASLSQDLKLADAMEAIPELKDCKTKSDAVKILKKMQKIVDLREAVNRVREEAETNGNAVHDRLVSHYVVGDCISALEKTQESIFDFVEVDPPYGIDISKNKKLKGEVNDQSLDYNEVDASDYEQFIRRTMKACYRVMKPNSWIVVWFAPSAHWTSVLNAIKDAGFSVRGLPAIWLKPNGQTLSPKVHLANCYETFFYARKGNPELYRQGRSNCFAYSPVPPQRKIHQTERPIEMLEDIINVFCPPNGNILTPFAGSGNTILAASNYGCTCIGYDLSEEYRSAYEMRVRNGVPGKYKSYI